MNGALRAQTLSAPNMTFWLGDPVFFRRSRSQPLRSHGYVSDN